MEAAILGISPGTRSLGLAVIRSGSLREWRIKTFPGLWSKEKLERILRTLEKLCGYYMITGIAIKKPNPLKSSPQLDALIAAIEGSANESDLHFEAYSLEDLHSFAHGKRRNISEDIAAFSLERFPELKTEYFKERNNKQEYYGKMFEAVLCAYICHTKSDMY